MPKICPTCQKTLKDNAIWCFYCGEKVDKVTEHQEDTYTIIQSYYSKPSQTPTIQKEVEKTELPPVTSTSMVSNIEEPVRKEESKPIQNSEFVLEQIEKMDTKPMPSPLQTEERMPLLSLDITREHMPDAQELEKAVNDIIHKLKVPKRVGEKTTITLDPAKKQLLYGTLTNIEMQERRLGKILNARAWQMLGNALYAIGDYEKAVLSYDKAINEDKGFRHAWEGKGYALRHLGDETGANHCFGTLRTLRSAFNGWLEKGNMHMKKGEFELAIECYKRASELDPDDEKPLFNLGLALKRLGRYEEAVQTYDKALAISEDPETWNNKGNALAKLGRYEDAVESFKNALRLKPDYETARVNMNICANRILKH